MSEEYSDYRDEILEHGGEAWLDAVEEQEHDDNDDEEEDGDYVGGNAEEDEDEDEDDEDEDEEEENDDGDEEDEDAGHGIQFEVLIQEVGDGSTQGARRQWRPFLSQREFLALLRNQYIAPGLLGDDDDDFTGRALWESGGSAAPDFPKVPSDEGRKLMDSGAFGANDSRIPARKALARRILDRELGLTGSSGEKGNQGLMAQSMLPSTKPEMVIRYDDPVCCGQFSDDGNFFYACVKDFKVRLYDTSSPYNWKHYKTIHYPFGQWTMTDADLSPDNKWIAFSSLQPHVGIAATDPNDTGDPYSLNLADGGHLRNNEYMFGGFAIFSVRFSGDGRHILAGTNARSIVMYDIERRKALYHVEGHTDDVNAVCFADKSSPHILYSGSDDCTIKVWDTRSLGDGREAGAFVGHTEGLTYIDSKGDGRYVLSNGKDQSMKLWDLRKAMSTAQFEAVDATAATRTREYEYDYRWQEYEDYQWFRHPHDNSLVTFRGHKVQRTLLRCHFSPPGSTDSRYVCSGSHDGFVYIWNLDATLAAKIDVRAATNIQGFRPTGRRYAPHRRGNGWEAMVRDVGWHPNAPMLVASSWGGSSYEVGSASLHSFNEGDSDEGDPVMGVSVNEKLEPWRL